MKKKQYYILVIGSESSGITSAIYAKKKSPELSIGILSKNMPIRTATCMAEGGCNAVISSLNTGDSCDDYFYDAVYGSDYLCVQDVTELFVQKIAQLVYETNIWGLPYNRQEICSYAVRKIGGGHHIPAPFFPPTKQVLCLNIPPLIKH